MTENNDDGGPAFPIPYDDRPGAYEAHPGMSLRDWFAGQALSRLLALASESLLANFEGETFGQVVARHAYDMADAMLAERAKK